MYVGVNIWRFSQESAALRMEAAGSYQNLVTTDLCRRSLEL